MAVGESLGLVWGFLKTRKKWWLTPVVAILLLFGVIMFFAQTSVLTPFIYALF